MNWQTKSSQRVSLKRAVALLCAFVLLLSSIPPCPVFALPEAVLPAVPVRTGPTDVKIFEPIVELTEEPGDAEIETARIFTEPLTPTLGRSALPGENRELAAALRAFKAKTDPEDVSAIKNFIVKFPESHWRPALELNLGKMRFESGYFGDALALYKSAWENSKNEKGSSQEALANDALSEYLFLSARLGRKHEVEKYLEIAKGRSLQGSIEERVSGARDGLASMNRRPECAYKCGPFALSRILDLQRAGASSRAVIAKADSTEKGTNLRQLRNWAKEAGLDYQIARRAPGAPLIVPSIVHWRVDHFAAVTGSHENRYHVQDSTFGANGNFWLSMQCLDAESDGYFLVPSGSLPSGWQSVSDGEGSNVWGKGAGNLRYHGDCRKETPKNCGVGPCCNGLPQATAWSMLATLNVVDTPSSYSPPIGPDMDFRLNYTHLEPNQPVTPAFPTFGPDWNFNWISYLTVDASRNVTLRFGTGGSAVFDYMQPNNLTNPYPPDLISQEVLTIAGKDSFQLESPDGSISVYNQPDGAGRIFMTKVIDPQGNATTITYDANFRITAITDALGQVTTLTYASNTIGTAGYYKITRITDPFSRQANFTFDSTSARIVSMTDVVGMQSSFVYDPASSFILSMTTPYGTSSFYQYIPPKEAEGMIREQARGLRIVFPDQTSSVVENWAGPPLKSFFWDRHAVDLYPGDAEACVYEHCKSTTWMSSKDEVYERAVVRAEKMPLESEVVYKYEGQSDHSVDIKIVGVSNKPIEVKRQLDNDDYQVEEFEYNSLGQVTKSIDPVDRTFKYFYSANGVDLLEIREVKGSNNFLIGKWQYNDKHLPIVYIDGSGRKTQYAYKPDGQIETITDADNKVTTYVYTSNYLTSINGPLTGSNDVTTMTYDGYKRLASVTDSEGYTIQYQYDFLNRPTKTIYPDGTFEEYRYNRADQVVSIDRIGRLTESQYDSIGQLTKTIDPLGRKTEYTWCSCGSLVTLNDGAGNTTHWHHDLQGRVTAKEYADDTTVSYVYENRTSRLKTRTDAIGQITNYSYFDDDTLATITYDNDGDKTSDVNLTWDPNYRRILTVTNGWGQLKYIYNNYISDPFGTPTTGGGMLQKIEHYLNPGLVHDTTRDITYQYDLLGRTTNRSINASANSVTWAYDAMSRVTSETNSLGNFGYSYVDQSASGGDRGTTRLFQVAYPNGQKTRFRYHQNLGDQRLSQIANVGSSGRLLSLFNYEYDPSGQIKRWQQVQKGNNLDYKLGYDDAGQLISARASGGQPLQPFSREFDYTYDSAGNRLSAQESAVETVHVGGTTSAGDVISLTIHNSQLPGGAKALSYTVQSTDSVLTLAQALALAVNTESSVSAIGVSASPFLNSLSVRSVSPKQTTYSVSTSSGATEQLFFAPYGDGTVNATIGGTKTTGDIVTLKFKDYGLPGGEQSISYTVQSADTLATIATALVSAINANGNLQTIGVKGATPVGTTINLTSISPNLTRYEQSTTNGGGGQGSERISLSLNVNTVQEMTLTGPVVSGNTISLSIFDDSLATGAETISYVVQSGDGLGSVATGITSAINANSNLNALKIKAEGSGSTVFIRSHSPTLTSYAHTSANEVPTVVTFVRNPNPIQITSVEGTTSGTTFQIQAWDDRLNPPIGPSKNPASASAEGATQDTAAEGLADSINFIHNVDFQSILYGSPGPASNAGNRLSFRSSGDKLTQFRVSTSGGSGRLLTAPKKTQLQTATISGTIPSSSNSLTLTIFNSSLSGGQLSKTHNFSLSDTLESVASALATAINSDAELKRIGIFAESSSRVIYITSSTMNLSTFSQSTSSNLIRITYGTNAGAVRSSYNSVNQLKFQSPGGNVRLEGSSSKPITGIVETPPFPLTYSYVRSGLISVSSATEANTTYSVATSSGATATLSLGPNKDGSTLIAVAGSKSAGNVVSVTVFDSRLSGGQKTINYTVQSSDTIPTIAENLASAITSDSALAQIELSATTQTLVSSDWAQEFASTPDLAAGSNSVEVRLQDPAAGLQTNSFQISTVGTSFSQSTTSSFASIDLGSQNSGNLDARVVYGGSSATGTTITLNVHNPLLESGPVAISHTILVNDTAASIATSLRDSINSNITLQSLGISATSSTDTVLIKSTKMGEVALEYDANGNMISDGKNTYEWDAENRLIKITYPGTGNNSQFTFDGAGRNVKIIEQVGGSTTSTKQFVWDQPSDADLLEERDSAGTVTNKFFDEGEKPGDISRFYSFDHLASCQNLTDSNGSVKTHYEYEPFGSATKAGTEASSFTFAGLYSHERSRLLFAPGRLYSATLARWLSRDPAGEAESSNLFCYVSNDPINYFDPTGYAKRRGDRSGGRRKERGKDKGKIKPECKTIACCYNMYDRCRYRTAWHYFMHKSLGGYETDFNGSMRCCRQRLNNCFTAVRTGMGYSKGNFDCPNECLRSPVKTGSSTGSSTSGSANLTQAMQVINQLKQMRQDLGGLEEE